MASTKDRPGEYRRDNPRAPYKSASEYDDDADAPTAVILKRGLPRSDGGFATLSRREIVFYTQILPATVERHAPVCLGIE
jgi:hypothetical protein